MGTKTLKGNASIIVGLLVFSGFITIFNEVEMNITLSTVSEMYNVPITTTQWLTTGYMLIAGTLMPLAAFVMSRLGSRNTVIGSLLALLVGILISMISNTFEVLLVGRLLQAVCAAFFMPVMFATIMAVAPKEKIGMYNGLAMLVLMVAPATSPTISGFILSAMGFRWLFTLMLPFIAIALIGVFFFMSDVLDRRETVVDPVSVILSCLGFGGIVFGIGEASSYGFASPQVIIPLVVGVIALAIYARKQLASDHPLLNLRILKNIRYRRSLLFICLMQLVLFGGILVLPLFLQRGWGMSAMDAGLYMLPGGVLSAAGNLIAGMAYDRFGLKTAPLGLLGSAAGYAGIAATIFMAGGVPNPTSSIMFICFSALYACALPFAVTAFTTNSLGSLEKRELPDGSSMNNTLNQIFGSLGTALYTLIVYQLFASAGSGAAADSASDVMSLTAGSAFAMILSAAISVIGFVLFLFMNKSMAPEHTAEAETPAQGSEAAA